MSCASIVKSLVVKNVAGHEKQCLTIFFAEKTVSKCRLFIILKGVLWDLKAVNICGSFIYESVVMDEQTTNNLYLIVYSGRETGFLLPHVQTISVHNHEKSN